MYCCSSSSLSWIFVYDVILGLFNVACYSSLCWILYKAEYNTIYVHGMFTVTCSSSFVLDSVYDGYNKKHTPISLSQETKKSTT